MFGIIYVKAIALTYKSKCKITKKNNINQIVLKNNILTSHFLLQLFSHLFGNVQKK